MYLRTLLVALGLLLAAPALTNLVVDPYQVWHDRWWGPDLFGDNQRYQTAGLIRRYLECDACARAVALVGTSLSENTTDAELRTITGRPNAIRLLAHGGYASEHAQMLARALQSGKVDLVLWELYRNYAILPAEQPPRVADFPDFLYTRSVLDDAPYLFNNSVFKQSVLLLLGLSDWSTDPGQLNSWHAEAVAKSRYAKWSSDGMLQINRDRVAPRRQRWRGSRPDWSLSAAAFEHYLEPLVAAHPEIEFVFFAPPVSPVRHGLNLGALLSRELVLRDRLAQLAAQRPNVSLFAFDSYEPIVTDSGHYRDEAHYSPAVGRWMLERIVANDPRFVLTPANVRAHGEQVWRLAIEHEPRSSCTATPHWCGRLPVPD
ncbi:MAG: hypothetical protein V2J12_00890 [Gammaproteobacteria bacterium]|jgi:hypothetical protein|nr:hypothetical protein [Gammaproteobacteria bacterium]